MKTSKIKVLVACEESQTVTKAFRKKGFEAYSCDMQGESGGHPDWHIKGDALKEVNSGQYDLIIAHPPCTFLSKAGARWMHSKKTSTLEVQLPEGKTKMVTPKRYEKALKAREFFMAMVNAPARFIAVENPTPLKVCNLPPHTQAIQPYEYGHSYSKRTLLWLKGLPQLEPTNIIPKEEVVPYLPSNTGGKKRGETYHYTSISQKESSKTFEGVAKAMAEQWGRVLVMDLWNQLGKVHVDADGMIEQEFLHFGIETDREDIWHWIEDTYDISVAELMFE